MQENKLRVLLFSGGKMGKLARETLESIDSIELTCMEDLDSILVRGKFDLIFSASYPSRISQDIVNMARLGGVNIHTSLLPEGRGSHPLNWALIWGREQTGITIHKIVDTYDAGDICLQMPTTIWESDNIVSLRARIEEMFPALIKNFFGRPEQYIWNARQQNQAHATYAQKRLPEDCQLNLKANPDEIYNLFRSCHPEEYPAFIIKDGQKKIITKFRQIYED